MFDPLDLFTAVKPRDEPDEAELPEISTDVDGVAEVIDDKSVGVHILDFPLLHLHPPASVLRILLEVVAPQYVIDIRDEAHELVVDPKLLLSQPQQWNEGLQWMAAQGNRFGTEKEMTTLMEASGQLRQQDSAGYNGYMTRIVSSPLDWLQEDDADDIRHLASRRLLENCGRTALPDITRTVIITDEYRFKLFEPALTSDNLGLKTWGSLLILAKRLVAIDLPSEDILELGAGTGLVGMMCAVKGARVMLTDLPEICENLQRNVELNQLDSNAQVYPLDWRDPSSFIAKHGDIQYLMVVVADPIYSKHHPEWVVGAIRQFLKSGGTLLIQVPLREKFEEERSLLWQLLADGGKLLLTDVETSLDTDWGEMAYMCRQYRWY